MQTGTQEFGARIEADGVRFTVRSGTADAVWLCLFGEPGDRETARLEMQRVGPGTFARHVPGAGPGLRYGLRADGPFDPDRGYWFDPQKLLMDPYASRIDRPWAYVPELALARGQSTDTAPLVPKAVIEELPALEPRAPVFREGGLIYEVNVRAFSMRHPDIPANERGTLAAFRHPPVLAHLRKIGVAAVEFMPVVAWIDERHLAPLGLRNAWGYNPVNFMALDPRLAPNGIADLRATVDALHRHGIGVLLDLVFNHTGESDRHGPTLSLRGIDNATYYRHDAKDPGLLVNDTGCGNTLACDRPVVRDLIVQSLRHFVRHAGVDGFRFDLAPVLGRDSSGFDPASETLAAIAGDPVLADRILIAEPWDIGAGGYQLGRFPARYLEWNDRCRDDARRFWRGDPGAAPDFATRLSGSSDIFPGSRSRSVNFIACHDGFALADIAGYAAKHNLANGEGNCDGHDNNHSWNNGVEGASIDPAIVAARRADAKALLATLFVSRGAILLTAGDEFGRTQQGNNNAYAQDNEIAWLNWETRDRGLEDFVGVLAGFRAAHPVLGQSAPFTGIADPASGFPDAAWLDLSGKSLSPEAWRRSGLDSLQWLIATGGRETPRIAILFNRGHAAADFTLPPAAGLSWLMDGRTGNVVTVPPRSVAMTTLVLDD